MNSADINFWNEGRKRMLGKALGFWEFPLFYLNVLA